MRAWMIPMKGHDVTAKNAIKRDGFEVSNALTTDPADNVLLFEDENTASDGERICRG